MFGGLEYIDQSYNRYQRLDGSGKVTLDLGGQPVGTPRLTVMGGVEFSGGDRRRARQRQFPGRLRRCQALQR